MLRTWVRLELTSIDIAGSVNINRPLSSYNQRA